MSGDENSHFQQNSPFHYPTKVAAGAQNCSPSLQNHNPLAKLPCDTEQGKNIDTGDARDFAATVLGVQL
jgi:hypothetical protein